MEPFTVYPKTESADFDKGKPYIVNEVRFDEENGRTPFLIANKSGDFGWHESGLFKEHPWQVK